MTPKQRILKAYAEAKDLNTAFFTKREYSRNYGVIKRLLEIATEDQVISSFAWANEQGWCAWTLETIEKNFAEFMKTCTKNQEVTKLEEML